MAGLGTATRTCLVCVGVSLVCLGVSYSESPLTPHGFPSDGGSITFSRQSPDDLLRFFIMAHELRDIEMYKQALHKSYRYWVAPDVQPRLEGLLGNPWLTRERDIEMTDILFSDPMIEGIHLRLIPITGWKVCQVTVRTDSASAKRIQGFEITVDPLIQLELLTDEGGTCSLEVNRTWMRIVVVPDPEVAGSWVIFAIWEEPEAD